MVVRRRSFGGGGSDGSPSCWCHARCAATSCPYLPPSGAEITDCFANLRLLPTGTVVAPVRASYVAPVLRSRKLYAGRACRGFLGRNGLTGTNSTGLSPMCDRAIDGSVVDEWASSSSTLLPLLLPAPRCDRPRCDLPDRRAVRELRILDPGGRTLLTVSAACVSSSFAGGGAGTAAR
jgi:hypothetical protein